MTQIYMPWDACLSSGMKTIERKEFGNDLESWPLYLLIIDFQRKDTVVALIAKRLRTKW